MNLKRRQFLGTTVALTASLAAPTVWGHATGRPKVVVIGGGAGGATAARYIAKDSDGGVDVTLIEPTRVYFTCFFSNLYIGGFRELQSIGHTYGRLASDYGINVIHDLAVGVDRDARTVTLAGGGVVPYDRLVVSPGIDFVEGAVPGWDVSAQHAMPHAYKAGSQSELLKAQIEAMPEGGLFCMVAPPNPYRCPPGPYERVSLVANYFKNHKPKSKILILDAKDKFSKQGLFTAGWKQHYGFGTDASMIEWRSKSNDGHWSVCSSGIMLRTACLASARFAVVVARWFCASMKASAARSAST